MVKAERRRDVFCPVEPSERLLRLSFRFGVGLGGTLLACGPRVPVRLSAEDSESSTATGGADDAGNGEDSAMTLATSSEPTSPGVPATIGAGSGPSTTGEGGEQSGGFDESSTEATGQTLEELCENVYSEEHTCITQTEDSWAVIGTDSGVICDIGPAYERLSDQSVSLAWDGSNAILCQPSLDDPAVVREDAFDNSAWSFSHPCHHLLDFGDELLVIEPRTTGQWATFYPDFPSIASGAKSREVPVEVSGSQVGAGNGWIYSAADTGPTVMLTQLGTDSSVNTSLTLNRGNEPIYGIDGTDNALFLLSSRTLDRYDPVSGELISKQGLSSAQTPVMGHGVAVHGLSCR